MHTHTKGFFWNGVAPWTQAHFPRSSLWELAPGISQLSHCNPEGLHGGEPPFPSASSIFLCFPSWSLGAWRTSHRDTCIAGDWNGDKAYGEERYGGKGITAAGERDLRRAAPLFLHQRSLLECGIRARQSVIYPNPLSQSPECQQEALEKPESGESSSWYVFKHDWVPPWSIRRGPSLDGGECMILQYIQVLASLRLIAPQELCLDVCMYVLPHTAGT